jgi:hypothetical protein
MSLDRRVVLGERAPWQPPSPVLGGSGGSPLGIALERRMSALMATSAVPSPAHGTMSNAALVAAVSPVAVATSV